MKVFLTSMILALVAQPAWAETVYYCVTSNIVEVSGSGVEDLKQERFKMLVDKKQVTLTGRMFGNNPVLDIEASKQNNSMWTASGKVDIGNNTVITPHIAMFKGNSLIYSMMSFKLAQTLHADCDKF